MLYSVCLNCQQIIVVLIVLRVVDQVVVYNFNGSTHYELVSCIALLLTCNELQLLLLLLVVDTLSRWHIHTLIVSNNIFRVHSYCAVLFEFEIKSCPRHLIYNGLPFNHVFFKFAFLLKLRFSMRNFGFLLSDQGNRLFVQLDPQVKLPIFVSAATTSFSCSDFTWLFLFVTSLQLWIIDLNFFGLNFCKKWTWLLHLKCLFSCRAQSAATMLSLSTAQLDRSQVRSLGQCHSVVYDFSISHLILIERVLVVHRAKPRPCCISDNELLLFFVFVIRLGRALRLSRHLIPVVFVVLTFWCSCLATLSGCCHACVGPSIEQRWLLSLGRVHIVLTLLDSQL